MAAIPPDSKESLDLVVKTATATIQDVEKDAILSPPTDRKPPPYTQFSPSRQALIVAIVTTAGFFSPLCGAVYLPSLILFEDIFKTTGSVINASVAVYMAVFAVAPLFGAAAADYGGRKSVYLWSLATFLVANTLLAALPPNLGALFTLRVFQVHSFMLSLIHQH
jgi:MFS family permease